MTTPITIALSKGHILRRPFLCIKSAEIIMQDNPNQSKALIFSINYPKYPTLDGQKRSDIPTYVRCGAADCG